MNFIGGTLDGLLGSAVASSCLLGFSVGLWARAVHSRGAGILAALAVGVVALPKKMLEAAANILLLALVEAVQTWGQVAWAEQAA